MILFFSLVCGSALFARLSGMDMPKGFARAPEIVFALPFGYLAYDEHGIWLGLLAFVWAYFVMETGIEFLPKGKNKSSGRKHTLTPVVDFICKRFKIVTGSAAYCAIFQALKGLLLGLAVFPYGLLLALGWPLAYYLGHKANRHWLSETLTGIFAGIVLFFSIKRKKK